MQLRYFCASQQKTSKRLSEITINLHRVRSLPSLSIPQHCYFLARLPGKNLVSSLMVSIVLIKLQAVTWISSFLLLRKRKKYIILTSQNRLFKIKGFPQYRHIKIWKTALHIQIKVACCLKSLSYTKYYRILGSPVVYKTILTIIFCELSELH